MPLYAFECPPNQRVAGYVEKLIVRTPWWTGKKYPNGAPVIDPKTNRQVPEPDSAQTWAWLSQQGLLMPPSANFSARVLAATPDQGTQPTIESVQTTQPSIQQHAPVHAPYGQPVRNTGVYAPPPMADPRFQNPAAKPHRQDPFEQLDGAALPSGSDPMLGDVDPEGGTFMDIDSMGNEVRRQDVMPVAPRRQGQ